MLGEDVLVVTDAVVSAETRALVVWLDEQVDELVAANREVADRRAVDDPPCVARMCVPIDDGVNAGRLGRRAGFREDVGRDGRRRTLRPVPTLVVR